MRRWTNDTLTSNHDKTKGKQSVVLMRLHCCAGYPIRPDPLTNNTLETLTIRYAMQRYAKKQASISVW
jgi:hypothetical protein